MISSVVEIVTLVLVVFEDAWLYRLLNTNNPYKERFAMFLLALLTVNTDVLDGDQMTLMWNYIERLRRYR